MVVITQLRKSIKFHIDFPDREQIGLVALGQYCVWDVFHTSLVFFLTYLIPASLP